MSERVRTSALARVEGIVHDIADRPGRWAALIGAVGTGKTWAVNAAVESLKKEYRVIQIECLQMETLSMSAIQDVLISQLGEKPLRFGPAKAVQLKRLLGEETGVRGRKVLLVIDEAHVLPIAVLRGLKRLRDMVFAAREGILSILLVAQPEFDARVKSEEVKQRILKYRMPPLKKHDGEMIVRTLAEDESVTFTDEAVQELAMIEVTPLALKNWVEIIGVWCRERGVKKLERGMVPEILRRTEQAVLEHFQISDGDIASRAGVSKATVSGVRHGKYAGRRETVEEVKAAIEALVEERRAQGAKEPEPEMAGGRS